MNTHDPVLQAARRADERARREVELLACIADSPRRSWPIVRECGITLADFTEVDTRCIAAVLERAADPHGPAWDRERIARTICHLLRDEHLWDQTDRRPFVSGMRWSPESLGALQCRVPHDPSLIRLAAAALLDAGREAA